MKRPHSKRSQQELRAALAVYEYQSRLAENFAPMRWQYRMKANALRAELALSRKTKTRK